MITKEILESHPVKFLKKEISESNIKGYSKKMKKHEIVALMLKPEHSQRFSHIVKKGEAPKPKKVIKIIRKKKEDIAEQKPKPEKKIVIKRTPKPAAPKPEKKIVIKRTPKPAAPKPEKKIVTKQPRKETPGSIEAERIKKRIELRKKFNPILSKLLNKIKTISDLEKIKNEGQKEINNIDKNLTLKTEYRKPKRGVRPLVSVFLESVTNKIVASQSQNKILK